jgi:hypothetical protein
MDQLSDSHVVTKHFFRGDLIRDSGNIQNFSILKIHRRAYRISIICAGVRSHWSSP